MYQTLSILFLLAVVAALALHYLAIGRRRARAARAAEAGAVSGGVALAVRRYCLWERLVHLAVMASFLTLVATGLWPALRGQELRGYLLLVHVAAGVAFAVSLLLMVLRWGEACRFVPADRVWLRACGGHWRLEAPPPAGRFDAWQKCFFWLSAVLGLTTSASMFISMLPLFGPDGLDVLLEVHRWTALLLTAVVLKHVYLDLLAKPGTWRALLTGRVGAAWARRYHSLWSR